MQLVSLLEICEYASICVYVYVYIDVNIPLPRPGVGFTPVLHTRRLVLRAYCSARSRTRSLRQPRSLGSFGAHAERFFCSFPKLVGAVTV